MRTSWNYIAFTLLCIISVHNMTLYAQSDDNFKKLQEISIDQIHQKKSKPERKPKQEDKELDINDSTFKLFDVDIDITLGEISLDLSWGDPVKNPKIRANRASNLFGPVRHNSDGTIRWHRGFDYHAPTGTPIYSVGDGIISLVQNHPDYGKCILITHKRPKKTYYSFYAHLSSVSVEYGQKVHKGNIIGKSGTTGNASDLSNDEAHLHFEYRTSPKHSDRKQKNPNAILKTRFYSADPKNKWQSNVGVVKKGGQSLFE